MTTTKSIHLPVLLREVLAEISPSPGKIYVDGTVGGGGHSSEILKLAGPDSSLVGFDRDLMMINFARNKLSEVVFKDNTQAKENRHFHLIHSPYAKMREGLDSLQISKVDAILLDLGYSSDQLLDTTRGFSFNHQHKLDLRFDLTQGIPADEFLNQVEEHQLTQILKDYGEESQASGIAREIISQRKQISQWTPMILSEIVSSVKGKSHDSGIHPATQTFQAIRIAVNSELDIFQKFLDETVFDCLKPGGKLVIITFHSLEDRMAKQSLKNREKWTDVPSKPVSATPQESRFNPRSRTAKLRIATFRG